VVERERRRVARSRSASTQEAFCLVQGRTASGVGVAAECWNCGRSGHFRKNCPHKTAQHGNG